MLTPDDKDARIAELEAEIAKLRNELDWLRKKIFGKMSEKHLPLDPCAEPTLFDDQLSEQEHAAIEAQNAKDEQIITKIITVKTSNGNRSAIDTSKLEVKEEHLYPDGINQQDYRELEPEITDSLAILPAQVYIKRIIRHKYVLKSNLQIQHPQEPAFRTAPLPPAPIYKCMASSSILADIIIDKFFYHLPFYRVIQKYKELGVSISSSTIGDWHAAVCEKLKLLKDYHGTIQTDGYQAYDRFEGMQGKLMLGCWAHARRKFVEALNENKTLASKGIEYIAALYKIESDAAQINLPAAQLAAKRQAEAYPVILDFEDWMQQISARVLKNGRMWRAIQYTYGLLPRLRRYVRDGKYNIDNNLIENAIRPLAIGRKNYLFCGNTDSAIRAGIVYSLIASCKAAQIEPRAWLAYFGDTHPAISVISTQSI